MKIRDIFRDPDQPWMYPFVKVKRDSIEGYYIDWSEDSGLIPDPELVQVGDLVQDVSLNATPYWRVTGVFENNIYVEPYGDNPFLTGVGAGGATLTDYDFRVFSGEAEQERIDWLLRVISERQFADYRDISYILLGTKAVRFGPNGAEGGWYTATDWGTRGSKKGMSPIEIMVADAEALQKLGLQVPPNALDGTLNPEHWTKLVGGTHDLIGSTRLPGENWNDPLVCARWVLTHPQPQIRHRNAVALRDLMYRRPQLKKLLRRLRKEKVPEWGSVPNEVWDAALKSYLELERDIRDSWEGDDDVKELCRDVALKLYTSQHPTYTQNPHFDAYWFTKELFIRLAESYCWSDVLRMYADTRDSNNRKHVAWALKTCKDLEALLHMADNEEHAEALDAALSGIKELDKETFYAFVETNLDRLMELSKEDSSNAELNYYRMEMRKRIDRAIASLNYYREHGMWSFFLDD